MNNCSIEKIAKELCDRSRCHHKCHDTTNCIVEDEAREYLPSTLTNEEKVSVKVKQIEEMGEYIAYISHSECAKKSCEDCKWRGTTNLEKADCMDYLIAEALYNAGYLKQSEVIEKYRKKVYSKMEKYTVFGREYIQRIMREVEKEMGGKR